MLMKNSQAEKRSKSPVVAKNGKATGPKQTSSASRSPRKVLRACTAKRLVAPALKRTPTKMIIEDQDDSAMDPCDNSNDSGLGLDHSSHYVTTSLDNLINESRDAEDSEPRRKRSRVPSKSDSMGDSDKLGFSGSLRELKDGDTSIISFGSLSGPVCATSKDGKVTLSITSQPEQQHRARYQTEGSRGAVKDRSGQGFPVIRLIGYNKPARLQVFIGSDLDRVTPHMFYQACRVCGKNSTPCTEQKIDGTVVIELQFEPSKNMIVTCDCVGILKERNVDVEHRFPDESASRSKKKSTRCRMVFRTYIEHPDGSCESLQLVSQPIACTQLPGGPEILKRSLTSSPCSGGAELFLLGKNFLKDTKVVFQQPLPSRGKSSYVWEEEVIPDKEFLQPTHLVCVIPPFHRQDITDSVSVRVFVRSNGKTSEPQPFLYLPEQNISPTFTVKPASSQPVAVALPVIPGAEHTTNKNVPVLQEQLPLRVPALLPNQGQIMKVNTLIPNTTVLMVNQPSPQGSLKSKSITTPLKETSISLTQQQLVELLRQKIAESSVSNSVNTTTMCPVEAKLLQQFVSESSGSLPAQSGSSVEKFLSNIESREENKASSNLSYQNNSAECSTSVVQQVDLVCQTQAQLHQSTVISTNIKSAVSQPVVEAQIHSSTFQLPLKQETSNFGTPAALSLPAETVVGSASMLTEPMLLPSHEPPAVLLQQESVISVNEEPSALIQPLITSASTFEASTSITPHISVEPAIVTNQNQSSNTPIILIDQPLVADEFHTATHNESQQVLSNGETLNTVGLDSDDQLINTQLGQLLTTDLVPEPHIPVSGGPLVRDVLLGSSSTVPILTPSTVSLGLEAPQKKSDGLLANDLAHMSDKDLLSYINTGCFDQVMP